MSITSTAGLAAAWVAGQAGQREQTMQLVAVKQQAQAEQAVAQMIEAAAQATPPPAPEGQGRLVDIRA